MPDGGAIERDRLGEREEQHDRDIGEQHDPERALRHGTARSGLREQGDGHGRRVRDGDRGEQEHERDELWGTDAREKRDPLP